MEFVVAVSAQLHDRIIRCSNGWRISVGRGLDIYQRPAGKYVLGACDLDLRPCLETDISMYLSVPCELRVCACMIIRSP